MIDYILQIALDKIVFLTTKFIFQYFQTSATRITLLIYKLRISSPVVTIQTNARVSFIIQTDEHNVHRLKGTTLFTRRFFFQYYY